VKQPGKNFKYILFIKIHLNKKIDKYGHSIFAKVPKTSLKKVICNGWGVER